MAKGEKRRKRKEKRREEWKKEEKNGKRRDGNDIPTGFTIASFAIST
jgi:hypothetical protein